VCRSCGTAGALFVEAEPAMEDDLEAETFYEAWFDRGSRARYRAA
jgi:hypothetical protein